MAARKLRKAGTCVAWREEEQRESGKLTGYRNFTIVVARLRKSLIKNIVKCGLVSKMLTQEIQWCNRNLI